MLGRYSNYSSQRKTGKIRPKGGYRKIGLADPTIDAPSIIISTLFNRVSSGYNSPGICGRHSDSHDLYVEEFCVSLSCGRVFLSLSLSLSRYPPLARALALGLSLCYGLRDGRF